MIHPFLYFCGRRYFLRLLLLLSLLRNYFDKCFYVWIVTVSIKNFNFIFKNAINHWNHWGRLRHKSLTYKLPFQRFFIHLCAQEYALDYFFTSLNYSESYFKVNIHCLSWYVHTFLWTKNSFFKFIFEWFKNSHYYSNF